MVVEEVENVNKLLKIKNKKPKVFKSILKKHYQYLDQLINTDYTKYKTKQNKDFFNEDMVQVDSTKLGDRFIAQDFDINCLIGYFDDDAWLSVLGVYKLKVAQSTCTHCKKLCFDLCIECTKCNYWYHFDCEKLDDADDSDNWLCSRCHYD